MIAGYKVHEFASRFPLIEGTEFDELVEDIKKNGLKETVKADHLGQIVDGRNRLRACEKAGIEPEIETLPENTDVLSLIIQKNLLRRHLSVGQRAMIAADLVTMRGVGRPTKDATGVTTGVAAKKLNVSRAAVNSAAVVKEHGTPALAEAVNSNQISVTAAASVARKSEATQQEAIAQSSGGKKKREKPSDAAFDRNKWRQKAESVFSQTLAKAPADLQDWARGTFRDVCGGSLRKEARLDIPDGDDVTLYDSEDVIARIDGMLKEIPVSERKQIKQAIGEHYIGEKPEQYLPNLEKQETDAERLAIVVAELNCRKKGLEKSEEASKVLRVAVSELRKIAKSGSDSE